MGVHEFGVSLQEVIEELFCGNHSPFVAHPFAVKPVIKWIGVVVVESLLLAFMMSPCFFRGPLGSDN